MATRRRKWWENSPDPAEKLYALGQDKVPKRKAFWKSGFSADDAPPYYEEVRGFVYPWSDLLKQSKDRDRATKRAEAFLFWFWTFDLGLFVLGVLKWRFG